MKRLLSLLLTVVIGVYIYDGYKLFGSSWSARAYYALNGNALTDFAIEFDADPEVKSLALHSPDDVSFDLFTDNQADYDNNNRRLADKYAAKLRDTTSFGVTLCGLWFKSDDRVLCAGISPLGHAYVRPKRDPDPFFALKYWPDGVDVEDECASRMVSDSFGTCEIILSENWTIHYEWLPKS